MKFRDKGVVQQFEPGRVLQYTHWSKWSRLPDTPDNHSVVTLTVEPERDGTLLTVRHERFASEELYKHAHFHWQMTLPVLKETVEVDAA